MKSFQLLYSVQGTGGSPTGPGSENRVVDQDTASPSRPVSSGLQVPGEPWHCHARTRHPWWTSRGVFPSKCPSIAPAEMSNTPRYNLALWKLLNEENAVLIPKKIQARTFPADFCSRNFLGARWAVMPPFHWLLLCFRVTVIQPSFFHGYQSLQEIIWIAPKKYQKLLRRLAPLTFWSAFRHFGNYSAEKFGMPMSP